LPRRATRQSKRTAIAARGENTEGSSEYTGHEFFNARKTTRLFLIFSVNQSFEETSPWQCYTLFEKF
jgi:hypothetical protein